MLLPFDFLITLVRFVYCCYTALFFPSRFLMRQLFLFVLIVSLDIALVTQAFVVCLCFLFLVLALCICFYFGPEYKHLCNWLILPYCDKLEQSTRHTWTRKEAKNYCDKPNNNNKAKTTPKTPITTPKHNT